MKKFQAGKTYRTRFIGDADSVLDVKVVKRTPKRITVDAEPFGVRTVGIIVIDGEETAFPTGRYAKAPTIRASYMI